MMMQDQKRWLAVFLSFFVAPIGMLYLRRPILALVYLLLSFIMVVLSYFQYGSNGQTLLLVMIPLLAAAHAYHIASKDDVFLRAPWYSSRQALLGIAVAYLGVSFVLRAFYYDIYHVPSLDMSPALSKNSILFISKAGYGNYGAFGVNFPGLSISETIKWGDVIAFEAPDNRDIRFVKRVVGLPGDYLSYQDRQLSVNGIAIAIGVEGEKAYSLFVRERLDGNEYIVENVPTSKDKSFEGQVPAGHLFMMGDNRDNSYDSRYWGSLPVDHVIGKVVYALSF